MSALAHLYLEAGDEVSGSDIAASPVIDQLRNAGAMVHIGHAAENVGPVDAVVVSSAIENHNPELLAARGKRLRIVSRGQAAADLCRGKRLVVVTGTHGKTTTTTMVAHVLESLDPLVISGGRLPGSDYNSRAGRGRVAVLEGDESDGSFLLAVPETGVVTSVDADHLDHYRDMDMIMAAFERFASLVSRRLVACVDDPGAMRLINATPGEVLTYGFGPADIRARDYEPLSGSTRFWLSTPWGSAPVTLPVPGRHNVRNALAAAAVGLCHRLSLEVLVNRLEQVRLPGRRLELVAEVGGARIYDDYGHHPAEVRATLEAMREMTNGKLICAFQPHRYTRLRALKREFASCFAGADELLLLPVYAAGEAVLPGADSEALAAAIRIVDPGRDPTVVGSLEEATLELRRRLRSGDVAVLMGAGDIYRVATMLAEPAAAGHI